MRDPRPLGPATAAPGPAPVPSGSEGPTVAVWLVDAREQGDAAARMAPGVLDPAETRRAASFVRDADRRCYVTAHVALRFLLGARLGIAPGRVRLTREPCRACASCDGSHGRPVTEDGPVHFSLSHGGDLALVALGPVPLGVDLEPLPSPRTVRAITGQLHPDEVAELAALPRSARPAAFARAWVRKEAYLKGLGVGLARGVALDYVGTVPTAPQRLPGWSMTDLTVPEGFAAAMAVTSPTRPAGPVAPVTPTPWGRPPFRAVDALATPLPCARATPG
ncbi:4'-phosphopantetheinyl transferase superfamily protein [Streptomyces sp. NPDC053755]|uniref:4'-phosphopantetheinyl transferase family protein n=1 Tax=Streptomyces sp. NPDC053755 TaxID=3155815 RepID=UPI0034335B2B